MQMQKKVAQQQQQLSRHNLENALSEMSTELRRINEHAQEKISTWKRRFNVCRQVNGNYRYLRRRYRAPQWKSSDSSKKKTKFMNRYDRSLQTAETEYL